MDLKWKCNIETYTLLRENAPADYQGGNKPEVNQAELSTYGTAVPELSVALYTIWGPGSWKFNNTLLDDENYKDLIRFIYPQIREKYKDVESKQLLWELIKMEIRAKTIKFSKSKRSEVKKRELTFQTELEELDRKICNSTNMDLDQDVLEAYGAAKEGLKEIYDLRGKGLSINLYCIDDLCPRHSDK